MVYWIWHLTIVKPFWYNNKGLVKSANVEILVSILFGLEVRISILVISLKEVLVDNPFVHSCVWCGVAFLRSHSGTPQSRREINTYVSICQPRET